ncbi:MAG: Gfo/Idh/MocA family oxidoreductase [Desulfobacteraceae bacterium]|jgi:predicted dehydrogenase|nr:Gfo/Idh/MocA family oxidoreductase [Desulfobacteraceae bacterium]
MKPLQDIDSGRPVRLGVIGAGLVGAKHAAIAAGLPGCRLVGIADPNLATHHLAEDLTVVCYDDYQEMISAEKPDGVIIATPTERHASVGIACAEHGVHLLVEKPIASDVQAARDLIACAKKRKVQLLVGHHRRFNPLVETAREVVQSGKIGRLVAVSVLWTLLKPTDYFNVEWRRKPGGGPVLINMIHDVDNLRYICGEIQNVYAQVSSAVRGFEVEDTACVTLRFNNGALGTVVTSDCVPSRWSYEATTGENPAYFNTHEDCYLFFGTEGTLAFPTMKRVHYASPSKIGWEYPIQTEEIPVQEQDPLILQIEHFCAVIRGEEAPRTSGEDALQTLAVIRAVLDSGASGKALTPNFGEDIR